MRTGFSYRAFSYQFIGFACFVVKVAVQHRGVQVEGLAGHSGPNACTTSRTSSRACLISAFTILDSSRSFANSPPEKALRDTAALPLGLFGPVDFAHGFQCLMASRCRWRCSNVQVRALIGFVL